MTKRPLPTHRPTRSSRKPLRLLATGVASLLLVAGCASGADAPGAVQAGGNAAAAEVVSPEAAGFLAKLGMSGRSATEVIDALDAQTGERQKDVLVSIRPRIRVTVVAAAMVACADCRPRAASGGCRYSADCTHPRALQLLGDVSSFSVSQPHGSRRR